MANTATVTGITGPGQALTAASFANVNGVDFQFDKKVVAIRYLGPDGVLAAEKTAYIEYANIVTVTLVILAGNTTVTIST